MKNPIPTLVLIFAGVFATSAAAHPEASRLAEISPSSLLDSEASLFEPRHIACGMTPRDVVDAMRGRPDEKLAPHLWVYWRFHTEADHTGKFNTLVVYFSEGRVTKFRLVERKALVALLTAAREAQATAVAKK